VSTGLRVALFVEGSSDAGIRRSSTWLEEIWNGHLIGAVGRRPFELVVPISKKDLLAMDTDLPRPAGSEPLDMKLVRLGAGRTFDAAVVAWDLHPAWSSLGVFCRWDESVRMYELLAGSQVLPDDWRRQARARLQDYQARHSPSMRPRSPRMEPGMVHLLCMDPEFESVLSVDERAVRRALGLNSRPSGWPTGWGVGGTRRPSEEVLRPAVQCLPRTSPVRRRIRGGWRERKGEWGEYILRQLLADASTATAVQSHPIAERLAEICS
jgi:hypothetical protein